MNTFTYSQMLSSTSDNIQSGLLNLSLDASAARTFPASIHALRLGGLSSDLMITHCQDLDIYGDEISSATGHAYMYYAAGTAASSLRLGVHFFSSTL